MMEKARNVADLDDLAHSKWRRPPLSYSIADVYRKKVQDLQRALEATDANHRAEAFRAIQGAGRKDRDHSQGCL
jgi:hypothetical protein